MNRNRTVRPRTCAGIIVAAMAVAPLSNLQAMAFDMGDSEWKITWNNTLKYSVAYRLNEQDPVLTDSPTVNGFYPDIQSQGDRNFDRGLVSNRMDILSELDVSRQNYGLRISGAAWYDDVYNKNTDSSNQINFLDETEKLHGRDAEVLDAFVYMKGAIGDQGQATARLGRHSLIYGESLFFGGNGIANAQGPVDVVKLLSVPGTQFKEILRPVNQISAQWQINSEFSAGAYYQLEWDRSNIPGAGSYLSASDVLGYGAGTAESLVGPTRNGGDLSAKDSGQGGMQLRYRPDGSDYEFGAYAARYHDKTPSAIYANLTGFVPTPFGPAPVLSTYNQVYAEDVKTVGFSVSTAVGAFNFAGEASYRWDAPLVSDLQVVIPGAADNSNNAAFAKGKTAHINLSTIYLLDTSILWDSGTVLAELAWNRTLSVTDNAAALDPNSTRDATAFRILFQPAYYQVMDGLDLSIPIGLGIGLDGKSSAVNQGGFGVRHGGDWSVGAKATYLQDIEFGVNYVNFFGHKDPVLSEEGTFTYGQSLADRDFISVYVKKTF